MKRGKNTKLINRLLACKTSFRLFLAITEAQFGKHFHIMLPNFTELEYDYEGLSITIIGGSILAKSLLQK